MQPLKIFGKMLMRKLVIYLLYTLCLTALCSCRPDTSAGVRLLRISDSVVIDTGNPESYGKVLGAYTRRAEYDELVSISSKVYRYAESVGDDRLMISSAVYLGQAFLMLSEPDSMYFYFNSVMDKAVSLHEYFAQMVIYNAIGLHSLMYTMNYHEALSSFYNALGVCEEHMPQDRRSYYIILSNIVNTCYIRNDSSGMEYAREVYDYGKLAGDEYVSYRGALGLAYMYMLEGDWQQALKYVEETMTYKTYNSGYSSSDALHGDVLALAGRDAEAEKFYLKSVKDSSDDYSTKVESFLRYGNYLKNKGRYSEAIDNYSKGIALTEDRGLYFYGHSLYSSIADALLSAGREEEALRYINTYRNITDSVFNVENERSFGILRHNYEKSKQEKIMKEKEQRYSRRILIASVSGFLLITVSVALYVLYRRRLRMYRQLIRMYQQHIQREKYLEDKLDCAVEASPSQHETSTTLDTRLKEIFDRLDSLMKNDELYRKNDITIEGVAEMLDTNRSYISRAVNQYTGKTFVAYLNYYRIRKAVEILSDPENDMPIKALVTYIGFNNTSTFYPNFQKETGVPPSRFRQEVLKMNGKSPEDISE